MKKINITLKIVSYKYFSIGLFILCISFICCNKQSTDIVKAKNTINSNSLIGNWLVVNYYYKNESWEKDIGIETELIDMPYNSEFDKYHNAEVFKFTEDSIFTYLPIEENYKLDYNNNYTLNGTDLTIYHEFGYEEPISLYLEGDTLIFEKYTYDDDGIPDEYYEHKWKKYSLVRYDGEFPLPAWLEPLEEDESLDSVIITSDSTISSILRYRENDYYYIRCKAGKKYLVYVKMYFGRVNIGLSNELYTVADSSKYYNEYSKGYGLGDEVCAALVFECGANDETFQIRLKPLSDVEGYYEVSFEETDIDSREIINSEIN